MSAELFFAAFLLTSFFGGFTLLITFIENLGVSVFQFSVALWVERRRANMVHIHDSDIRLEVLGHELWAIIENNARLCLREFFMGTLQDNFDILLCHFLPQFPMNDLTVTTVQNASQVIEGGENIDIGNINIPVFMRL